VFRRFLMEGVEAYKNYLIDEEDVGEDVLSFDSEADTTDMGATVATGITSTSSQSSSITVCH